MWQRRTLCISWCRTKRAQMKREWPRTMDKEPDDPLDAGLIEELDIEASEVARRLFARRRLQAHLKAFRARRAEFLQEFGNSSVAAMQFQDHDNFPEFDHRALPPANGSSNGESARRPAFQGKPWKAGRHRN
jgi:hypothetical protein